ncbi:MAG: hypothetical protein HQL49_09825 [Gammaproteobacteria bacterium]|nr:hypothetical protein [Gammaproteobacteria bacterium]
MMSSPLSVTQFANGRAWQAITQAPATLNLDPGVASQALRFIFDFRQSGGFVVARLPLQLTLPELFTFAFTLKGDSGGNTLEFKLADAAGNCWRYSEPQCLLTPLGRKFALTDQLLEFAWGPAGGGAPQQINALEIALVAGPGGAGELVFESLTYHPRGERPLPQITLATPAADWSSERFWQGESPWHAVALPAWMALNFNEPQRLGGVVIDWSGVAAGCALQGMDAAGVWQNLAVAAATVANRTFFRLPGSAHLQLRIELCAPATVKRIELLAAEIGRSELSFFQWIALHSPRGCYPRHLLRAQSYWTAFGDPSGNGCALLNEEGALEVDAAEFSLEPFIWDGTQLLSWEGAVHQLQLADAGAPLPQVLRRWPNGVTLQISAAVLARQIIADYTLTNHSQTPLKGRLFLALRPFQLTPPWQSGHRHFGQMGRLHHITSQQGEVVVNDARRMITAPPPDAFGATPFSRNEVVADLLRGDLPAATAAEDAQGWASAALAYDIDLAADSSFSLSAIIPYAGQSVTLKFGESTPLRLQAAAAWQQKLAALPQFHLPQSLMIGAAVAHTALAHILLQRSDWAIQPGPRRYTRAWIRDGVTMAAALLRAGCQAEVATFLRHYATFQSEEGNIPCCTDQRGADWLVEYDSLGQFVFGVMEYYRFTGDRGWLIELWPAVERTLAFMQRLQSDNQRRSNRHCHGLLPESASHEGYLSHPVHAYWDDFWALRGLEDGCAMAALLQQEVAATTLADRARDLRLHLAASIALVQKAAGVDYLPGSVELADFDPAATATAIAWLDDQVGVSAATLTATFDRYLEGFRRRREGAPWHNYSAYEIRIIAALVRLGRRSEAHELLDYFLADRRPLAWNQWPEISWHDYRTPGHLGDLPHAWIGAEYYLAWLALFVYERHSDASLVFAGGIPRSWLASGEPLVVTGLITYWGRVDLTIQQIDAALHLKI